MRAGALLASPSALPLSQLPAVAALRWPRLAASCIPSVLADLLM